LRKLLISVSIILSQQLVAQSLRHSIALPYVGVSAYSTNQNDGFSFTSNQAALAATKKTSVGLYGERRFLLAATSSYAVAAAIPTKLGNFGLSVNYAGFKNFNENKIGLAYGRSLGKKVDIGVQFNHYGYRVPIYGNASAIFFEAGAIMHFTDKFNGGFHIYNPVGGKLNNAEGEKLASAYKLGFGYDASDNFFITSEIIKEEDKPVNVVAGFQYQFAKQFFARAGFMSESTTAYAGVGLSWKNLRLDVAGSYHPQLGFSPGLMLLTNFGKEQKEEK
jgi:hypothetical protein